MKKSYIFNDESKRNSYGFKVLNAGIDLSARFTTNPICLNNHQNDTKNVLGKWTNIEQRQGLLIGTPSFDTEDEEGKEVVRKVNNGTIVSVSMGLFFDPEDMVLDNGELCLMKCELFEVSFVAVPSNSNAVTLYNKKDGTRYSDQQMHELTLSMKNKNTNNSNMNLIKKHLQLAESATENEVLNAVQALELRFSQENIALKADNTALKTKYDEIIEKQTAELKANYEAELELAVKDGRIDEASKETFNEMALSAGFEKGITFLKGISKRESIASQLGQSKTQLTACEKMSWDELDKGNHLAKLKVDNPTYYAERFEQQYGKKPNL